jgi:hypothetical protein
VKRKGKKKEKALLTQTVTRNFPDIFAFGQETSMHHLLLLEFIKVCLKDKNYYKVFFIFLES